MTARSDLAAIRALGDALRGAGATPGPSPSRRTDDLAGGLERLRALVAGEPVDLTGDLTDEQHGAYVRRYSGARPASRTSGWRQTPQCGGCKRILKAPGIVCPGCGYLDGGGYVGVPAPTSHLERWR